MTTKKVEDFLKSVEAQKKDKDLFLRDGAYCCQKLTEHYHEAKGDLMVMEHSGMFDDSEIGEEKKRITTVEAALRFYGSSL